MDLIFYADADHVILEVLESWMSYINPIFDSGIRDNNAFTRFNYPGIIRRQFISPNLKEILS